MRILYLSLSYVPSRRASSVQVMKMCEALARRGHEVVLVAKAGREPADDAHAFYNVDPNFAIETAARPLRRGGGLIYAAGMAAVVARRWRWADVVYCRDPLGAWIAAQGGLRVVFEAHGIPSSTWLRALLVRTLQKSSVIGVVAISAALRRDLIDELDVRKQIVVAHDACDPPSDSASQRELHQPRVIGYVGNLYPGRGIETIVELAGRLPAHRFKVVGGTDADLARWRATRLPQNLELLGFRPQRELATLYREFDVVLMPHASKGVLGATGASDISRWTSPMKMFEYMSSGVPLIASRLPVFTEVLRHRENSLLVDSDDVNGWIEAIELLLSDDALRFQLARTAQADLLAQYTWDARAESVLRSLDLESAQ